MTGQGVSCFFETGVQVGVPDDVLCSGVQRDVWKVVASAVFGGVLHMVSDARISARMETWNAVNTCFGLLDSEERGEGHDA